MRALIRSLVKSLLDVLDHAPNLAAWKASYFIVKASPYSYLKPLPASKEEKLAAFASRYKSVILTIEEATLFLEGNNLMETITSLDKVSEIGVFHNGANIGKG